MATTDSTALIFVHWIGDQAIAGGPGRKSARGLAQEYLDDPRFADTETRVKALLARETAKNFMTGFLTGVGGLQTLPVAVPAALGAAWAIQARMAAVIAILHGHDVGKERVRRAVLVTLAREAGKDRDAVKRGGVRVGQRMAEKAIQRIPTSVLIELNKMSRVMPLVGGLVGGAFDAAACRAVGKTAHELFRPQKGPSSVTPPAATRAAPESRGGGEAEGQTEVAVPNHGTRSCPTRRDLEVDGCREDREPHMRPVKRAPHPGRSSPASRSTA